MAVKVGSARIDENGRAHGGKAGNQTGKELSVQNWYYHSKGGEFRSGAVQRRNLVQQRLFQQLRPRDELHGHGDLHRRGGLVLRRRHLEALYGLVSLRRRVEAGGSLLQFGRRMGARLSVEKVAQHELLF